MTTQIVKTLNPSGSGANNYPTLALALADIRASDPVGTDTNYRLISYIPITWPQDTGPLSSSDSCHWEIDVAAGLGVNELNRGAFDIGASGLVLTFPRAQYDLHVPHGVHFKNWIIKATETGQYAGIKFEKNQGGNTFDNSIRFCRILDQSTSGGPAFMLGASSNITEVADCLIVTERANGTIFSDSSGKTRLSRNTVVARGAALGTTVVLDSQYGGPVVTDTVFIGIGATILRTSFGGGVAAVNCYANTAPSAGTSAGINVNTAAGALVVNETSDFRPTPGGGLVGKGSNAAKSTSDILGNNRGLAPDAGAYQGTPAAAKPTATITNVTVTGNKVRVVGTTTNVPTAGTASLAVTATAYNDGIAVPDTAMTLGSGSFDVELPAHVGEYTLTLKLSNDGGTATIAHPTTVLVPGATASINGVLVPDGGKLVINFTTSGNPLSGTCIVPVGATPNGAVQVGPLPVTIVDATTATVEMPLGAGNYGRPIARFTTDNGTGFPATGGNAVSVADISGSPEAPAPVGTAPVVTVTSVSVTPPTASGSVKFAATVLGTNSPSQAVSWAASAGQIASDGTFTAPDATTNQQVVTITATSIIDPSKSGTATVTIAALIAPPAATVSAVAVAPNAATVAGGASKQFTASVTGTNAPPQGVNWSATAGQVSASGLFTAPASASTAQTVIVTATSTFDPSKSGTATVTVPAVVVTPPGDTTPPDTTPPTTTTRVFSVQLTIDGKTGVPNLSGLVVRCYNGDGSLALSINNGTTDANGWVSVAAQSTLPVGGVGMLVVRGAGRHFADFVQVA